jgi:hypothetical protein
MYNPRCAYCGHMNRADADVCGMCDFPLEEMVGLPHGAAAHSQGGAQHAGALPTDIPSPYFQGLSDVISPTLEIYRTNYTTLGLLVLVTLAPLAVLEYFAAPSHAETGGLSEVFEGIGGVGGIGAVARGVSSAAVYWLTAFVFESLLAGAVVYAVVEVQRTGKVRARDCLRWSFQKLPRIIGADLLYILVIYVFPASLLVAMSYALGAGVIVVFLLALLPWIIASLMFSLVLPAVAAEGRGVFESFTRSRELTNGFKGLIFLSYFVWWLVTMVVGVIVTVSFAARGSGWTPASLLVQTFISLLLKSTTYVLTTYIFLGILNERRHAAARAPAQVTY